MRRSPYRKYVMLDRDGTIVVDKCYQKDPALTELMPNAREGLEMLRNAGFGLVMVTNQSGIGRGFLTADDLAAVNRSVVEKLGGDHDYFAGIYYCPHVEADECACRKPKGGMAEQAAAELGFRTGNAYMVGDKAADVGMGRAVGAKCILVRTGDGPETERKGGVRADYVADDLVDAARWILGDAGIGVS